MEHDNTLERILNDILYLTIMISIVILIMLLIDQRVLENHTCNANDNTQLYSPFN
jgi:hypothetical protein